MFHRSLFILLVAVLGVVGCNETSAPVSSNVKLEMIDIAKGNGTEAKAGQRVSVHYTGWLYDESAAGFKGKKFDSSHDRGQPLEFPLGGGRVIEGWDQGVAGMKVGGRRTLTIPPELGYGSRGAGRIIPPNATLIFDVELMDVR